MSASGSPVASDGDKEVECLWEKVSYTWVIKNTSHHISYRHKQAVQTSPKFFNKNNSCTFEITLLRSRDSEDFRVFLSLVSMQNYAVDVKGTLVISNSGDYVICQSSGEHRFTLPGMLWECTNKILWNYFEYMIPDDILKIKSEILIKVHTLEMGCIVSSDSPEVRLQKSMDELFESATSTDIVFEVEEETFKAHRLILSARSPVFAAMFTHESIEKDSGVVKIVDFGSDNFKLFLRFVYCGKADIPSVEVAVELFRAAEKYDFPDLKFLCLKYIRAGLNSSNVGSILLLAETFGVDGLKQTIMKYLSENITFFSDVGREVYELIEKENPKLLAEILAAAAKNFFENKSVM